MDAELAHRGAVDVRRRALRWLLIAAAATVVLLAVERLTRRLAPLATLLALSLTFPDRAPPRFRIALRNGSTRQLHDRIAEARRGELGGTPAEAAERVLELVAALSIHDRTTRGHSERVRAYSRMLGEELGLGEVELDRLQWAGLLHDVGKLLIPDAILNKPGRTHRRGVRGSVPAPGVRPRHGHAADPVARRVRPRRVGAP